MGSDPKLIKYSSTGGEAVIFATPIDTEIAVINSVFDDEVAIYCQIDCFDIIMHGDYDYFIENVKLYIFSDGVYSQIALKAPPAPKCSIRGIYLDVDILHVYINDYDGTDKMSVWHVSHKRVLEIETLPFVDEEFEFSSFSLQEDFSAIKSNLVVKIFDSGGRFIGEATPCAVG